MLYLTLKALHLIGIVAWFAGLFYIVRLFIYHVEAHGHPEPKRTILHEQFSLMARRLWYAITVPAMVFTTVTGVWLITYHPLKTTPWLHLKLTLLLLLFGYHFWCGVIRQQLAAGGIPMTAARLRAFNEVPTFLLVTIVFTAVGKSIATGLWALLGCTIFMVVMVVFFLKRLQGKK